MNKLIVLTVVLIFVVVCVAMINIKIIDHKTVDFISSREQQFMAPGGGGKGGGKGGGGKGGGKGKGKQPPDGNPPPDSTPDGNPPQPDGGCQPANTTHYPGVGYIDNTFLAALKK